MGCPGAPGELGPPGDLRPLLLLRLRDLDLDRARPASSALCPLLLDRALDFVFLASSSSSSSPNTSITNSFSDSIIVGGSLFFFFERPRAREGFPLPSISSLAIKPDL